MRHPLLRRRRQQSLRRGRKAGAGLVLDERREFSRSSRKHGDSVALALDPSDLPTAHEGVHLQLATCDVFSFPVSLVSVTLSALTQGGVWEDFGAIRNGLPYGIPYKGRGFGLQWHSRSLPM